MKKQKRVSIILYLAYATFLILFITFGTKASGMVAGVVQGLLDQKNIADVTVDVEEGEELLANKTHYLQFTAHGKFSGDAGLQFESLDPEYLTVNSRGAARSNMKFEGNSFDGRIKVTSKYDKDFEKIFTVRFIKKSPDTFSAEYFVKGYRHSVKELHIGVPVYVFAHTTEKSNTYNVTSYDILYDEEYFEKRDGNCFIPIKPTPEGTTLSFTVRYEDGKTAQTDSMTVTDKFEEVTKIDSVIFSDNQTGSTPSDKFVGRRGENMVVMIYNEGEPQMSDYSISCEEEDMRVSSISHISFTKPGVKHLTITLPNGFEYKFTVTVRNIMELPTLNDDTVNATHSISMLDTDHKTFKLGFSNDVTYDNVDFEYDSSMMEIQYDGGSFTIVGKSHGTTELKLIIDDGFERLEDVYSVELIENKEILAMIGKNLSLFVSKFLGHMMLFAALGFLSMNMFRFFGGIYRPIDRFCVFIMTGIPSAVLTEVFQLFIPGRSGRYQDVLIDMFGFFLGAFAFMILFAICRLYLRRRERATDALAHLRWVHKQRRGYKLDKKRFPRFVEYESSLNKDKRF